MGIMVPITFNQGRQRAHLDNQADQRFDQETQVRDRQIQGLDLGLQKGRMELGEAQKNLPLKQMRRDADTITEIAKFGAANLGRVADEDLPDFMAQLLSDMPAFGKVQTMPDGQLFDGKRNIPMSRQEAARMLQGLMNPEKAMELKMQEAQYINEQGQVETMTAGEAKGRGLGLATDATAGYGLDITKAQARDAGKRSALELGKLQSEIAKNYAAAKGGLGYDFSKQNPDAIREGVIKRALEGQGFIYDEAFKEWTTPEGEPVSHEDIRRAQALSDRALELLSAGHARDTVEALRMAQADRRAVGGGYGGDAPPVQGARRAKDGTWYVQSGTKPNGQPIWSPVIAE